MECGAGKRPGGLCENLEQAFYSVVFPMCGEAVRAGMSGLTDMSKQAPVVAAILFVCLHDNTHFLSYICGIVHLKNVNAELFL